MSGPIVEMTSSRPYLIRAIHEWISDNGMTPYILVDAQAEGLQIPVQFVENGKIILNISERAVQGLHVDHEWLLFSARFGGQPMDVTISIGAVLAIYAKENGRGMVLENGDAPTPPDLPPKPSGKPRLQVVK